MKVKDLLYSQVPEEGGVACHIGFHIGGTPSEQKENEDPWASAFIGGQGRVHKQKE